MAGFDVSDRGNFSGPGITPTPDAMKGAPSGTPFVEGVPSELGDGSAQRWALVKPAASAASAVVNQTSAMVRS